MRRSAVLVTLFMFLICSAATAYAYPVQVDLTGLGGVGDFQTSVYHCTDSDCSSLSYYTEDYGNPNSYLMNNEGSGIQYFAEFDFQECFVPFIYRMGVSESTCNDCFDYYIPFFKEPDCYSPVLSISVSDDVVSVGDEVVVNGTVQAVWLMPPEFPNVVIPAELRANYSNHIDVYLYIDGSPVDHTTVDIVWSETEDVSFSFIVALSPGVHEVGIYTKVDNDCECSGSSFRSLTTNITVLSECGNSVVEPGEECDDGNLVDGDGCNSECIWEFCGDSIVQLGIGETCEGPDDQDNSYCSQATQDCDGLKTGIRDEYGYCDLDCGCVDDPFSYSCVAGSCGAECDDQNPCDDSGCEETYYDYCEGLKLVEYDSDKVMDSTVVSDSAPNECLGDCLCTDNPVDCSPPSTNTYCVEDVCGAECDADQDCATKCVGDVYYYGGTCDEAGCSCDYEMEDCTQYSGWYDTGATQWVSTGQCNEKEQKEQVWREYGCGDGCEYDPGGTQWIDTGATRNKPDDTPCNDGLFCTEPDVCTAGVCGGSPRDCSDSVACTDDSCNEVTDSCEHTPDDSICDNELWCDGIEICDMVLGCQAGTPVECSDGIECTIDSCDEANDECDNEPDNTVCDDGLWCNGPETCNPAFGCWAGAPPDCSGNDLPPVGTCFYVPDGLDLTWDYFAGFESVCNESNDSCTTGVEDVDSECSVDNCDAECDSQHPCDDSGCEETYYDYCQGFKLVEYDSDKVLDSTVVSDSEPNQCLSDCLCTDNPVDCSPPGTNTYCVEDICDAECDADQDCAPKCVGSVYYYDGTCDSECGCDYSTDDCSQYSGWYDTSETRWVETDQCNEKEQKEQQLRVYGCSDGCEYAPGGTQWVDTGATRYKDAGTVCVDGLFCTVDDVCGEGTCSGSPRDCSDSVACTEDYCNEAQDTCEHTPDDSICDNGLWCDGEESCDEILGCYQSGSAPSCNDGVGCTQDSCNEGTDSCDNTPDDSACDDELWCNGAETCDAELGCQGGTAVDCSPFNIDPIGTCFNTPDDSIGYTWDFFAGFTSECNEATDSCTTGTLVVDNECSVDLCDAQCDVQHPCEDSTCEETYNDYCDGLKLVEYDNDKVMDSTLVSDSAPNECLGDCLCTENPADCSPPSTNTYCVEDVCGADCDIQSGCENMCVGNVLHYAGYCTGECGCNYETIDCDQYDGWYDTGETRWVETDQCNEKQQKEQRYQEYSCHVLGCEWTVTDYQWVDTGSTRYKDAGTVCVDGLFCTVDDVCGEGTCSGSPRECSDGVVCTDDSCNEGTDSCENTPNDGNCDNGLWCDGIEYCDVELDCQAGQAPDCSVNSILVDTCFYIPDSIDFTFDYYLFDSYCNEGQDVCDLPPTNWEELITHTCSIRDCDAECEVDGDCDANSCSEEYQDYCSGVHLIEYDDDKVLDSTIVDDSASNDCLGDCTCTDNPVDCSPPATNTYCAPGECGAVCDDDLDCGYTECDQNDNCYDGTYRDYNDVPNTCDLDSCGCSQNECIYYVEMVTDNDNDGWDINCDGDCNDSDDTIYPGAPELCDNKDNDCDGEIDEGLVEDCGEGVCTGITVCEAGVWSDCSTSGDDAGVCVLCDDEGTIVYDGTQDSDCDGNDLPEIATCFNVPDSIAYTWDYAPGFDSECIGLYECSTDEYDFTHTCDTQNCGAECEENVDCTEYIVDDFCYYSNECDSVCECVYDSEYCPEPGTIQDNMCYYGEQACDDSGCDILICELQSEYDRCDPVYGCIPCVPAGTLIDTFYDGLDSVELRLPLDSGESPRVFVDEDYRIFTSQLRLTGDSVDIALKKKLDIALVNDISGSMDDDCGEDGIAQPGEHPCKINDKKDAETAFIDFVINGETSNKVSLVSYSTNTHEYIALTDNKTALFNLIEQFQAAGATCIACGMHVGMSLVNDGDNPMKAMILMSDGRANRCLTTLPGFCTEEIAKQEAIDKAVEAWNVHGIRVYTVAFGNDSDTETMQEIAALGNGNYYYAENANISQVYLDIAIEMLQSYPVDPYLDAGGDALMEWSYPGAFSTSEYTGDFGPYLDGLLDCTCLGCEQTPDGCLIDFNVDSGIDGILTLDELEITGCILQEPAMQCSSCSECGGGTDCVDYGEWSDWDCPWEGVCDESAGCQRERTVTTYTCNNPGTMQSYCSSSDSPEQEQEAQERDTEGAICGSLRDCPENMCIDLNLTVYPRDGYDFCSQGVCAEYSCSLLSSVYDPVCEEPVQDSDNDGVPDTSDQCPETPEGEAVDQEGCACSQKVCDDQSPYTTDTCNNETAECVFTLTFNATGLVISEVFYDTPGVDSEEEWVEIFNPTDQAINISGYVLSDNTGSWVLPDMMIGPLSLITIAKNWTGFFNLYGCYPNRDGLTISLSNSGDMVNLTSNGEEDFVAWEGFLATWDIFASTGRSITRTGVTNGPSPLDWLNDTIPSPYCLDYMDFDDDGYNSTVDCDDNDPSTYPGAPELCDGVDNDCDGMADNAPGGNNTITQQCGSTDVGECSYGTQACESGSWSSCSGAIEPSAETCDGKDNDCDASTDEGVCGGTITPTGGGGGPGPSPGSGYICNENWTCGDWRECLPRGEQTRTCTDQSHCGSHIGKPPTTQSCTYSSTGPEICQPGIYECINDTVVECSLDGAAWEERGSCDLGCEDGACTALNETGVPPGGGLTGLIFGTPAGILGLSLLIIVIAGLLIYWLAKRKKK